MRLWPIVAIVCVFGPASAEGAFPEVRSLTFHAGPDPLVFWTPGLSERVLVRARIAPPETESAARLVVAVEWGVVAGGAPVEDASVVWSDPEEAGAFEVHLREGDRCEIAATVPIARRAREWGEAGLDVVLCRVRVGEASATLHVIPAGR